MHVDATLSLEDGEIEGSFLTLDSTIQQNIIATAAPVSSAASSTTRLLDGRTRSHPQCRGNQPAKMPGILGSLAFSYDLPIRTDARSGRHPDATARHHLSRHILAAHLRESSVDRVPDYAQVNLNFEYIPTDSNLTVQSRSPTVQRGRSELRYTDPYGTFTTSQQYIPPRQIMGTVGYSF